MINTQELRKFQTEQRTAAPEWSTPDVPTWTEVRGPVQPPEGSALDELLKRFVDRATLRALTKRYEDGSWFAEIAGVPEVWGHAQTEEASLEQLESVLRAWVEWKIEDKDGDIPVIDGIDLNILS